MNIFKRYSEVMRLVGNFPVVEGWPRTISVIIGFIGIVVILAVVCFTSFFDPEKHFKLFLSLLAVFSVMFVLPLYYPR